MQSENIERLSCKLEDKHSCCSNKEKADIDLRSHWDDVYNGQTVNKLGWYEENPEPSLRLIKKAHLEPDASILNVGAGATTLVDELLKRNYSNIIVNDISEVALDKLKARLAEQADQIKWMVDDLTKPKVLTDLGKIDLWHDRAVLHFFLKESDELL